MLPLWHLSNQSILTAMSLDDLTKNSSSSHSSRTLDLKRKRSYAGLLPVGLLLGFLFILGILFGDRLLPAIPVETAPVITLRAGESSLPDDEKHSVANNSAPPEKGSLVFQASGWIEPDPYTVYISTLINGVVDEVHALEGQSIKKGDLVATLIDDEARLDFQSAQQKYITLEKAIVAHCSGFEIVRAQIAAALQKIEASETLLTEARDTASRFENLNKGVVSQQQIVQARLATQRQIAILAEAKAEIPQLEARLTQLETEKEAMTANLDELATARDRAKLTLDRTRIISPMDGIVLRLHAAPGKKRMLDMDSATSAVIVELYDPNHLQARIDVPLNEAAALSPGQPVELVSDLLPDKIFAGIVTRINGQADIQRNTLQAKVEIKNPDKRLRPEMLVRAKFFALEKSLSPDGNRAEPAKRLALYVPEDALINDTQVWIVNPDLKAEKRTIKLGRDSKDGHRLTLEGLRSGESVILPPHAKLEEGDRVRITTANH